MARSECHPTKRVQLFIIGYYVILLPFKGKQYFCTFLHCTLYSTYCISTSFHLIIYDGKKTEEGNSLVPGTFFCSLFRLHKRAIVYNAIYCFLVSPPDPFQLNILIKEDIWFLLVSDAYSNI